MADSDELAAVRDHFDVDRDFVAYLNGDCLDWAWMDHKALQHKLQEQGESWYELVKTRCPHLFAAGPVFISEMQFQQMSDVIAAVEAVVGKPEADSALGVFYGYDFHLNAQGAHLIEVNTNAGGPFLNALLIDSQRGRFLYGTAVFEYRLQNIFIDMFRNEWQLARGDETLKNIAIVDEQPEAQYLYPEFLLAKKMFEDAGIAAHVVDPVGLLAEEDGLYCDGERIDMIYNRLTDFELQRYPGLRTAWEKGQLVMTPNPSHHRRYSDKRNLVLFSDADALRARGVSQDSIDALCKGVPQTKPVLMQDAEHWWEDRKQWFFKPVSGYGGKGAYRGDKLTRRVFEEIMQSDYVAQRLALPDERKICMEGSEPQALKYDVRCYVYDGEIQLAAARLYQGQTTNFRTAGGGFALVREVS